MELDIRGKVAIVTGGSKGTGKVCVEVLASQGVRVAACARGFEILKSVAEEITSRTETEVLPVRADVTSSEDVKRFISAAYDRFGRIDILVNNATLVNRWAGSEGPAALEIPDEYWLNHFNIKLIGNVRCIREVLPYMRERKWGRIINMAGGATRSGGGTQGSNNSATINLTKVLSDEVAKDGITVNAIHPGGGGGGGGTEIRVRELAERQGISIAEAEAQQERRRQQRPGPRVEARDTANMVLFLSSDKAAAITGQAICVTGLTNGVYY